jgi:hypothetical protein
MIGPVEKIPKEARAVCTAQPLLSTVAGCWKGKPGRIPQGVNWKIRRAPTGHPLYLVSHLGGLTNYVAEAVEVLYLRAGVGTSRVEFHLLLA